MDISKMNDFQHYLQQKRVHKASPNKELAASLLKSVKDREKLTLRLDVKEYSRMVFENVYDCLRELLDALLALDGYKSYSHEAAISYLKLFGVSESIISDLDRFRAARNDSKYYGKIPSLENAEEIKKFYENNKPIILNLVQEKLK